MSKTDKVLSLLKAGKKVKQGTVKGLANVRATMSELRVKGYVIPPADKGYYKLDLQKTKKSLLK